MNRGVHMALIIHHFVIALAFGALQQPLEGNRSEVPCRATRDAVTYALHQMSPIGTRHVQNRIDEAFVQFRLHRTKEASASLDSALSLLDVTRGRLMTSDERDGIRSGVDELRQCMNRSTAPPLATLTVQTYEEDDRVASGRGAPAEAGALVRVDELPLGRTGAGGIFRGPVPSGPVRVTAENPPSEWGEGAIDLPPGGAGAVSVLLQSSKEVSEETPLVVVEADGGILSGATRTVTLKFIAPAVTIRSLYEIDLLGPAGNIDVELRPMFSIANGAMVAIDAAKVTAIMRTYSHRPLVISVLVSDKDGVSHASRVEFRVE
jgi:hypothetical protein